ncbi:response regulator transcription factor [Flavobacterium okayamense]|uniref:DNA-binding response regulator n=1 Tax=Flavobacterium okayamense TaxID=2830782 RepID=A0ABM7S4J6_9FLAO|nr:response regulator transcription factor [Flavobacterium okayamense]BCY28029.1 DNA-binding response regulator [Flavobacterium okayamense]
MSLKILILDDHKVFSESLKLVLETHDFEVMNVTNPKMALSLIKTQNIDILISDIEMPEMNGVDFIKLIKEDSPNIEHEPKIIVLTTYKKINLFKKLIALGIDAYLSKNVTHIELLSVINKVISGEKYYEASIYNEYLKSNKNSSDIEFTVRELDVLKLIMEEKTTAEIAEELGISNYTVEGHRKNLLQKTNSKNVVGLIKYTLVNNLI